jgi:hypothetical protein
MRQTCLSLAALLAAAPVLAAPPTVAAKDMIEVCNTGFAIEGTNSPSMSRQATCIAYLDAVVATVAQVSALGASDGKAVKPLFFCLPNETTHEQLARTYYRFLQANAKLGDRAAAGVAMAAFTDAWPCKH